MPKFAKAAKFTQNPPKLPKNCRNGQKKSKFCQKGQICLQNPLKFDQNWENPKNCQKFANFAKFVQNCPSGPKTAKLAKNAENAQILARSPAPPPHNDLAK